MSDKPRLKDSDEILTSLGRAGRPTDAATAFALSDQPAGEAPPRRRRGRPPKKREPEPPVEQEDRNPLDFGKYELAASPLPQISQPPAPEPEKTEKPRPRRTRASSSRAKKSTGTPAAEEPAQQEAQSKPEEPIQQETQSKPEELNQQETQAKPMEPIQQETQAKPEETEYTPYEFPKMSREELEREAANQPLIQEYSFEEFGGGEESPNSLPPKAKPGRKSSKPKEAPPQEEPPLDRRGSLLVDDKSRDSFMEELSKKFEEKFSQRFGGEVGSPEEKDDPAQIPDFWETPIQGQEAPIEKEIPEPEEDVMEPEAEEFVSQFMEETQREEESRSQEFRDTLARKFMRERERYLKELGIAASMDEERRRAEESVFEEPEVEPMPKRRLDYQIQPEMHTGGDASAPVTYTRTGRLRVPEEEDSPRQYLPPIRETPPAQAAPPVQTPQPTGKKSSEELLMELAAQTKAAEERLFRQPSSAGMSMRPPTRRTAPAPGPAAVPVRPIPEARTEDPKPRRGSPWKVIVPITVAAMLLVTSALWYLTGNLPDFSNVLVPSEQSQEAEIGGNDTLTVYETRDFGMERQQYKDVLVKRSGVGITNLSVDNLLVISEVETSGRVALNNVSVGGAIHIKNCAVEELDLTDVQTPRIIINNSQTPVILRVNGNTDIGMIELKTGATLEQTNLTNDALGIRGVMVSSDSMGSVSASLFGLTLPTLATQGEAILHFSGTRVDTMTSDGSISLDGTGKIVNLAISAEAVSAMDASTQPLNLSEALKPMALAKSANIRSLQVVIKGVSVSTLNLKSPGDLNVSSDIDTMAAADSLSITGGGTVGSLIINERFGNARLQIDLSGVRVLSMICEAEARINAGGTSKINDLTCNASTYALGNKVNTLRVNNDRVIYENQPDSVIVAPGIRPPETVADNPNLDYNVPATQSEIPDTSGDEVSTTCGHTRETGGFLKGDGSKSNPFEVSTAAQLAHVAAHTDSFFIQTKDIDISEDSTYSGGFPMIASEDSSFSGEYDGQGYTIKNLRIMGDQARMGLFAENTGIIRNVHILSGEVTSTLETGAYVGGIAGINLEGGQILACSNRAKISAKEKSYAGGVAGYNYGGRIRDCYNAAKITGAANIGGIVGVNREDGSVAGCYNVGTIEGEDVAGAIAGTNDAKITNCYFLEDTAEYGIGLGEGTAFMCTSEELQSAQMVDDLSAGNEDTLWVRGSTSEGAYNYPILKSPTE